MNFPEQLTLNIRLRDDANFTNFYTAENQRLISNLHLVSQCQGERFIYIWGEESSGRSHLLQACCSEADKHNLPVIYLPLKMYDDLSPEIFADIENTALICIDDIECICANSILEDAFFHAFNKIQNKQAYLLISGKSAPKGLSIKLPDLQSRLASGVIFKVLALSDRDKIEALRMRAKIRGINLPQNAAEFLLKKCPRDASTLFTVLDKLDNASLTSQSLLTIPFIKKVLSI